MFPPIHFFQSFFLKKEQNFPDFYLIRRVIVTVWSDEFNASRALAKTLCSPRYIPARSKVCELFPSITRSVRSQQLIPIHLINSRTASRNFIAKVDVQKL